MEILLKSSKKISDDHLLYSKKNLEDFLLGDHKLRPNLSSLWQEISKNYSFNSKVEACSYFKRFLTLDDESKKSFFNNYSSRKSSFLPIESFKDLAFCSEWLKNNAREDCIFFKSSGTGSKERSKSFYTSQGLLLYKLSSLKAFKDMLSNFFPSRPITSVPGYTLIPSPRQWENSSLATMLSWICEFWPVKFIDLGKPSFQDINKPCWVFGTALHFLEMYKNKERFFLPEGSIVIETGGMKGSGWNVDRQTLYSYISKIFNVSQNKIISEYGMCELSCQAYDFYEKNEQERAFRFPFWVDIFVTKGFQKMDTKGEGSLIVFDPLRVDYPVAIRTQDIANITCESKFLLKGRVPNTVLKGCSLNVEELICDKSITKDFSHKIVWSSMQLNKVFKKFSQDHLDQILLFFKSFFQREDIKNQILDDFSSKSISEAAIDDLMNSLNKDIRLWIEAVERSELEKKTHILLILPNSHPFVIFYPFLLAYFANIRCSIRLPRKYGISSFLGKFIKEFCNRFFFEVCIFDTSFKVERFGNLETFDHIIVYGDQKTKDFFKSYVKVSQSVFGHGYSATLAEKLSFETLQTVVKDAFSLAQRGCFSSRVAFFITDKKIEKKKIIHDLIKISNEFIASPLSLEQIVALDHEQFRYSQIKTAFIYRDQLNAPLFPCFELKDVNKESIERYLSQCQFVLPIFFGSVEDFKNIVEAYDHWIKLSLSKNIFLESSLFSFVQSKFDEISKLGESNQSIWDGTHQKVCLFSGKKIKATNQYIPF